MSTETHEQANKLIEQYEAIRQREYEVITDFLELLPKVDTLSEERVSQVRDALFHADHPFLLVFVGPFSSGKSSIVNALLGETLLRVGPTPTTDRISILRYGEEVQSIDSGGEVNTVFHPSPLLKKVSFVDTPGLESIFQKHEEITRKFLHRSDVVLLVMLATQAMSQRNVEYMQQLRDYGKKVIIVVNQADLLDEIECETVRNYVLEQSQDKLGFKPEVWMVSAKLGMMARQAEAKQTSAADGRSVIEADVIDEIDPHGAMPESPTRPVLQMVGDEPEVHQETQISWEQSGLHQIEAYIDTQLGDVNRLKLKLQTPLQITQNVHRVALEAVKANQSVLDQYQGIAENVEGQLTAYRREQERLVRESNETIRAQFSEASGRGAAAIKDIFQLSGAFSSVGRGFSELLGIARLFRRGDRPTFARVAFEKVKVFEPLDKLPEIVNKLGPRLEGKDVQDTDDLVKYAQKEIEHLPAAIKSKVIGNIQPPMTYDRSVLNEVRPKLEMIEERARKDETDQLDQSLRSVFFSQAVWMLLVIVIAVLAGLSGKLSAVVIVILLAAAGIGLLVTPIFGRILASRYENRLLKLENEYIEVLSKGTDAQVDYGMRLRHDVVAPLTRLVETQTNIQNEQMSKLQSISSTLVEIEGDLAKLGKRQGLFSR